MVLYEALFERKIRIGLNTSNSLSEVLENIETEDDFIAVTENMSLKIQFQNLKLITICF